MVSVVLGSILQGDGLVDCEVRRRIGIAKADFDALAKIWTHSALTYLIYSGNQQKGTCLLFEFWAANCSNL